MKKVLHMYSCTVQDVLSQTSVLFFFYVSSKYILINLIYFSPHKNVKTSNETEHQYLKIILQIVD